MNKPIKILGTLVSGILLSSCENAIDGDILSGHPERVPLSIEVSTEIPGDAPTKGLVTGNTLPVGSHVGIRIVDSEGSRYDGTTYENVKYSREETTWRAVSDVLLSGTPGTVYAYYPWKDGASLTSVPIGGDDFMYATAASVDILNSTASLEMTHVMAEVTVTLENKDYAGTGTVTGMTWSSSSASGSGTLNAITGGITASNPGGVLDSGLTISNSQSIYTSTPYSFFVVPTKTNAAPTFSVTMDGQTFTATGGSIEFKSGHRYAYKLKMKNMGLSVGEVNVIPWSTSNQGTVKPS